MFRRFANDASGQDEAAAKPASKPANGNDTPSRAAVDPQQAFWLGLKMRLHERLLDMLNLGAIDL